MTTDTTTSVADWLRGNIHRLRTVDPASDDLSDLEPLRDIVGDARVVSIGEACTGCTSSTRYGTA